MKTETIEEAAAKYLYGGREGSQRKAFIEGAKWQIKQLKEHNKSFICDSCGENANMASYWKEVEQ